MSQRIHPKRTSVVNAARILRETYGDNAYVVASHRDSDAHDTWRFYAQVKNEIIRQERSEEEPSP